MPIENVPLVKAKTPWLPSIAAACILSAFLPAKLVASEMADKRLNVLFLAVDDFNHWGGGIGRNPQCKTPALDALAARGMLFTAAYCPAPICNPSRAALLTGKRPGTTGVYENTQDWRPLTPKEMTLPGVFARAGYHTVGVGKIQDYKYMRTSDFDEYCERKKLGRFPAPNPKETFKFGEPEWAPLDCEDAETPEYKMADYAIAKLKEHFDRPSEKPLFLACGLFKPHAPWFVPRKYFDMHPLDEIKLPPVKENPLDEVPLSARKIAHKKVFNAIVDAGKWKESIQGYLAACSFADAQMGRILEFVYSRPDILERTIIVLWSDHGWHLGEKGHFGKYTLWEEAVHLPMIWRVPGMTPPGTKCEATVDLMCLYPTLLSLCGIERPPHVEGEDISILLKDPNAKWDKAAISTYRQNNHSIRKGRWHYIQYANGAQELYDQSADPYEWHNLADDPAYAAVKLKLQSSLPKENARPEPVAQSYLEMRAAQAAAKAAKKQ